MENDHKLIFPKKIPHSTTMCISWIFYPSFFKENYNAEKCKMGWLSSVLDKRFETGHFFLFLLKVWWGEVGNSRVWSVVI